MAISDPDNKIVVKGHTDNTPINTPRFRDNWQLSTSRALTVLYEVLKTDGMDPRNVNVGAYGAGEYQPIRSNDSVENRAFNRRVDIVIRPKWKVRQASAPSTEPATGQ